MSDNLRRYRAIRDALTQWYPGDPKGNRARHLTTLAAVMSGIGASKTTQLPKIASHVPDGTKAESRVKRFSRWLRNDQISDEVYFIPYADHLLAHLAVQTLVRVIDGSVVGRCRFAGWCDKGKRAIFPKTSLSLWWNTFKS